MSVQDSFAGRQGNCPRCKQPFTVPHQSVAAGTPPPVSASPPQHPPTHVQNIPLPKNSTQGYDASALRPPPQMAAPPPSQGQPRLEVVHGPTAVQGKSYDLLPGRAMVLGRDAGADLTIESDRVSRRHCRFEPSPDGLYVVEDMGSANGTLVNQARIQGRKVLMGGEYIQAGDCLFRFCE